MAFQPAEGLRETPQAQAARSTDPRLFSNAKMLSIAQHGKVTLENGWVANDNVSWGFLNQLQLHPMQKHTYYLIGPDGAHYVLLGAWPTYVPHTTLEMNWY